MVTPLSAYLGLLGLVALERLAELALSARNARRALAQGGFEAGRGHYPAMVVVHALFLVSCAAEALRRAAPPPARVAGPALAAFAAGEALRWWAVSTLGDRWNTRIVVVPGAAAVTRGPYRFLRHPNYLGVALEVLGLPLAYGGWRTALVFSIANAALLAVRIPAEERALGPGYAAALGATPRLVPALRARREVPP